MKKNLLPLFVLILSSGLWSCNDQCKETRVTRRFTQVTRSLVELRAQVKSESARTLVHPGKMYVKDNYLFVNEIKKGIHVIDNRNPASPKFVAFINIPGNGDIAVRNNILYADSFSDLVALDIEDPTNAKETGRIQNVFVRGQFEGGSWALNESIGIINDSNAEFVTETITTNCEESISPVWWWNGGVAFLADMASFSSANGSKASPNSAGGSNGQAGSMARFALHQNFLYTVSDNDLHLFNISNPAKPIDYTTVSIGWGIETIFPYQDKLFLGSTTGMYIYDNSNPAEPKQLSIFQHGRACDPVVVSGNIAYVTIRTGTGCGGDQNQLDLVDVSNASSPQLIKSYQMQNPHGLSIDFPTLYLCEGEFGLKVFNATDRMEIDRNLISHFKDIDAYDVISLGKTLLLIGKDGFYQYDSSDPKNVHLLSKIPVQL